MEQDQCAICGEIDEILYKIQHLPEVLKLCLELLSDGNLSQVSEKYD